MSKKKNPVNPVTMQRLFDLRAEKGLSRAKMEKASGIPENIIYLYETGKRGMSKEYATQFAKFFGVSVEYLKGEVDYKNDREGFSDYLHRQIDTQEAVIQFLKSLGIHIKSLKKNVRDLGGRMVTRCKVDLLDEGAYSVRIEGDDNEYLLAYSDLGYLTDALLIFVNHQITHALPHFALNFYREYMSEEMLAELFDPDDIIKIDDYNTVIRKI